MKPQRRIIVLLCLPAFLAGFSCESSREAKPDADTAVEKASPIDTEKLVEKVEKTRDREFEATPRFRAVENLAPARIRGSDAYVADRAILEQVLFGKESEGLLPYLDETDYAQFDPRGNVIRYEKNAPAKALQRALAFALVDALNREAFASPKSPETWDEALALAASARSDAAFTWAGMLAANEGLELDTLAQRPEVILRLDPVRKRFIRSSSDADLHELEDAFVAREGFALASALYRAGGWSAAELARISPPQTTNQVVRPDRWLGESSRGEWTFDAERDKKLEKKGWVADRSSRVGPGLLAIWLAAKVDRERSRSVYASWQSDTYRVFRKDGQWWFEWLSLWKTPSDATQISGALNKGLSSIEGARYEVVDAGPTVSLIATSDASIAADFLLARATENAQILPTFVPEPQGLVEFVPTTLDAYLAAVSQSELDEDEKVWSDPATSMTLSVEPLSEWQLQKTDDPSARWVARKGGASILMTTQLVDPMQPAFETNDFEKSVVENFAKSVASAKTKVERVDSPVARSIRVQVEGQFEGQPTSIRARIFRVGDVITTFSLKGSPERVAEVEELFGKLSRAIEIEAEEQAEEKGAERGKGIIEFKVE